MGRETDAGKERKKKKKKKKSDRPDMQRKTCVSNSWGTETVRNYSSCIYCRASVLVKEGVWWGAGGVRFICYIMT